MDTELRTLEATARRTGATFFDRVQAAFAEYGPSREEVLTAESYLAHTRKRDKFHHNPKAGPRIKLKDMDDDHLMNTAALFYRYKIFHPTSKINGVTNIDGQSKRVIVSVINYTNELYYRGYRKLKVVHKRAAESQISWFDIEFKRHD